MHLLCYDRLCDGAMRIYICICLYVHKETLIGFAENMTVLTWEIWKLSSLVGDFLLYTF